MYKNRPGAQFFLSLISIHATLLEISGSIKDADSSFTTSTHMYLTERQVGRLNSRFPDVTIC